MILETLDVKKNDIFVYSLNKFDLNRNFKMINKDAAIKYPKPIHFNDVCRFINDGRPKNLIVYRLLTNLPQIDQSFLKYGFLMNLDGSKEVIYFDPVFAIKELEEYSDIGEYPFLRFRIQQIGLLSMMTSFGEAKFHEVYAFDLEASEVRWQNDRVFAEIIFAFDEVHFDEEDVTSPMEKEKTIPHRKFVAITAEDVKSSFVEEDPGTNANTIKKLRTMATRTAETLADNLQLEIRKKQTLEQIPPELPRQKPAPTAAPATAEPKPVKQTGPASAPVSPVKKPVPPGQVAPPHVARQQAAAFDEPAKPKPGPAAPAPQTSKAQPPSRDTVQKKSKQTFGEFLTKVKQDIGEVPETPEESVGRPERIPVISLFKTSSNIQDFVAERGKKQVVLKLRKRD